MPGSAPGPISLFPPFFLPSGLDIFLAEDLPDALPGDPVFLSDSLVRPQFVYLPPCLLRTWKGGWTELFSFGVEFEIPVLPFDGPPDPLGMGPDEWNGHPHLLRGIGE